MTNQTVEPTEPVKLVARKDGKPGCPERVWLGGVYPARCSCGIDECHRHGKFDVVEGDQW